jgi:hypothetical protein
VRFLRWSVVAGLLVVSACGGSPADEATGSSTTAGRTPSTPATATATGSAPAGSELLAFTAPAIGGGDVDASVYQGRPTLLWFWAPW